MAKPSPLQAALSKAPSSRQSAPVTVSTPSAAGTVAARVPAARTPGRVGRVMIGGYFAPEVQSALKIIAAEERTTVQNLLAEGLDLIFAKRQRPQIASISAKTT